MPLHSFWLQGCDSQCSSDRLIRDPEQALTRALCSLITGHIIWCSLMSSHPVPSSYRLCVGPSHSRAYWKLILSLSSLWQEVCSIIWLLSQIETSHFQLKYACGQSAATWRGVVQIHTHASGYSKTQKLMPLHVKNFQICRSGLKKESIINLLRKRIGWAFFSCVAM